MNKTQTRAEETEKVRRAENEADRKLEDKQGGLGKDYRFIS